MKGFYGSILRVNLTDRSHVVERPDPGVYQKYLGGKGLGTWLLNRCNPPGVDPLAPGNCLIFATGPVTASSIWGGSRYGVFTKSPQTNFYSESYSGGRVPEAMDSTGYDAIVIEGRSPTPVVLDIRSDRVDFHDATDLWGQETYATEAAVIERHGRSDRSQGRSGTVVIGPAAENLVRFGVIKNDRWRSAGRTGVGTVLGAKKVKAVIFQGQARRAMADPAAVLALTKKIQAEGRDNPGVLAYKSMGTSQLVKIVNNANAFPTRYWAEGRFEHWEKIGADALHSRCAVKPAACAKCFMACGRQTTIREGRHAGLRIEGPEYETIYAFGGLCLIDSIEEIAFLNDVCDRLGMDTISAGNLVAFTMEASKRRVIDYHLAYGDAAGAADLLHLIARREGPGAVLAEGIVTAARAWGLEDVAVHVKGMEPAGYDPRVLKGMGLAYATSDRGACHLRSTFYKPELTRMIDPAQIEGKAELFLDFEDRLTLFDTLIFCRFFRDLYTWPVLGEIVTATTGLSGDQAALRQIAANVATLVRSFNVREGLTKKDDWLPRRLFDRMEKTDHQIKPEELEFMLQDYYRLRGWDREGIPRAFEPAS